MSPRGSWKENGARPLVAVVCSVPLLGEAVEAALDFAEVRVFSERGGNVIELLRWLRPDGVVVDSERAAAVVTAYAREHDLPVVHVSPRDPTMRVLRAGQWELVDDGDGPTPEAIRNVIAGALFARGGPVQ